MLCFFFFKQKTAYEMRISDWSSDVCSSDLALEGPQAAGAVGDDVAVRRREGDRRRLGLLARQPLGHYRGAPRRAGIDDAPGGHAGIVRRRPVEGAVARLRSGRPLLHLERLLAGGTEGLAAAKQQADDRGSEGAGQASARGHRRTSCLLGTSQTRPVVTRVPLR